MWKFQKDILDRMFHTKRWTNRKIAFVGILIATSVSFVLIFSTIMPIIAMPTFKVAAGGLPVKLTGFIFGPVVGGITGIISDLISFALRPFSIHFYYTAAFALAGIIPGVIGYFMNRRWKYPSVSQPPMDKKKYNYVNTFATLIILAISMTAIISVIMTQPESTFKNAKLIHNKYIFMGIILGGSGSLFLGVLIFRFVLKPKTFNALLPLIAFSALLEVINVPLVALGDKITLGDSSGSFFMTALVGHFLFSPIKAWANLIIIFVAYSIVSPLIYSKTSNGWDNATKDIDLEKVDISNHEEKALKVKKGRKN